MANGLPPLIAQTTSTSGVLKKNGHLTLDQKFTCGTFSVHTVAVSPDSQWLALAGYFQGFELWRLDRLGRSKKVQDLEGNPGGIEALSFSPDGQWLASGSRGAICLWQKTNRDQFQQVQRLGVQRPTMAITTITFSSDSKWLASAYTDRSISVWRAGPRGWYQETVLPARSLKRIFSIAFSSDGQWLAAAADDLTVCLWPMDRIIPA